MLARTSCRAAACISLGIAAPSLAQVADLNQPIVVTGAPLPAAPAAAAYNVTEISQEKLRSSASGRIEDALSAIAGLQQFRRSDSRSSNPSAQGITLRGLGGNASSRSLVLLDGVPMADPFFGYIPLSSLAPERLAGARVTRGGGAGAFGAGAVAGLIELASAGPRELGLLSAEAMVDDRGEGSLSASVAPRLGQGFAVLSARWDRGQGFWTTPQNQRVTASSRARYSSWSSALRLVAPLSADIEMQARALLFDDQRTLRFTGADSASSGQDASLRLIGRGPWQFDALAYIQARDFSNIVISATSFRKTLDQRATPSTGLGGKLELRPPLGGRHILRLGADWRRSDGIMLEDAYSGVTGLVTARRRAGGRNADLGLFADDDWVIGSLTVTAGIRADRWTIADGFFQEATAAGAVTINNRFADRSGWQTSLHGGVVWRLGGGLKLRGSAYSGLRQPTLNELYRPFTVFPVVTRANAALVNERLVGFEGGLDWQLGRAGHFSVTVFDNRVDQAIANVTIRTNLRERRNIDAVHARGFEFGFGLQGGPFRLDGALALNDAKVVASGSSAALDGLRPAQTPQISASATLGWTPRPRWTLAVTLKHLGAQFEDDLQVDRLPAATTLDLFAQLPIGRTFSAVFRAENLTDTAVITRNQGGSIDLGVPRTLWIGLRARIN